MTEAVSNCSGYFVSNRFTLGAEGVFGFPLSQLTMVKIAVKRRSGEFISWGGWSDFGLPPSPCEPRRDTHEAKRRGHHYSFTTRVGGGARWGRLR